MSEENNNLELWEKVEETNPNYTKNANVSGNKITSIAPQYQIKMVTEQFGVYGKAWGFRDIQLDYSLLKYDLVTFKGLFFFPDGEFHIINSAKLFRDNNRTKVDDDFAKKLETDSLTKAISKLGFNADIFMGRFDDPKYVGELTRKYSDSAQVLEEIKLLKSEVEDLIPEADLEYVNATIDNENIAKYPQLKNYLEKLKK